MVLSLEFFASANWALVARWFVLISLVLFTMFQVDKALGAQAALYPGPIRAVFFMLMVIHGFSLGERFLTDWTIHARGSNDWYKKKVLAPLVKGFEGLTLVPHPYLICIWHIQETLRHY